MAKKSAALTKEEKRLVSQGASKGRKSANAQAMTARMIVGGTSLLGAGLAGAVDKRAVEKKGKVASFKLLGMKVPTNVAIGLGGATIGFVMGKGEVAAAAFGGGLGFANGATYAMVMNRKTDDDDDDDDE